MKKLLVFDVGVIVASVYCGVSRNRVVLNPTKKRTRRARARRTPGGRRRARGSPARAAGGRDSSIIERATEG